MTFSDKIDKILETNNLRIKNIYQLEQACGAARGAINRYYKENKEPGRATVKRIIEVLNINVEWWDREEGPMYQEPNEKGDDILNHPLVISLKAQIKYMEEVIKARDEEITRLKSK